MRLSIKQLSINKWVVSPEWCHWPHMVLSIFGQGHYPGDPDLLYLQSCGPSCLRLICIIGRCVWWWLVRGNFLEAFFFFRNTCFAKKLCVFIFVEEIKEKRCGANSLCNLGYLKVILWGHLSCTAALCDHSDPAPSLLIGSSMLSQSMRRESPGQRRLSCNIVESRWGSGKYYGGLREVAAHRR